MARRSKEESNQYTRDWFAARRAQGLCHCGEKLGRALSACDSCLDKQNAKSRERRQSDTTFRTESNAYHREYGKVRRQALVASGRCPCGKPRVTEYHCQGCLDALHARYDSEATKVKRAALRAKGLCACGKPLAEGYLTCTVCRERTNATGRKRYSENKHDPEFRAKGAAHSQAYRKRHPIKTILALTKANARLRGLEWALMDEQAIDLFTDVCFYCAEWPTPAQPNGIDRVDSARGYVDDNVVSACGQCNRMKLDIGAESFYRQCHKIAAKWLNDLSMIQRSKHPAA